MLLAVAVNAMAQGGVSHYDKSNPLVIGLDMDYPPLEYVDEDGIPHGYDVEFTSVLMKRLGIHYTYQPNTWEDISGDVMTGRSDLGMMVYSPYRKDSINYSRAVFRLYYQLVFRKDESARVSMREVAGKKIAYMSSRPIRDTLEKAGAQLFVVKDLSKAVNDLAQGQYDAVLCFRYQAKYFIEHYRLTNLQTEDLTLTPREYCYVSHDKALIDAIDRELLVMEQEDIIDSIYGDDITSRFGSISVPTWVYWLVGLLLAMMLIMGIVMQYMNGRRMKREMERARRSERMKSVFLGNISHALRTPLNAIIGFSELLGAEGGEQIPVEERRNLLGLINGNGKQLLYFFEELLQLSNIEANDLRLVRTEFLVRDLLEDEARAASVNLHPGVEIQLEGDPLVVYADPAQMRLVVDHLLGNAVKHTRKGCIGVTYEPKDKGLLVRVTDTGDGIPEELRENIFSLLDDPNTFVQSETPGLGLTICRAVIEKLGGKIGMTSEIGKGTSVWFWIPVTTRDVEPGEEIRKLNRT